jgi:hypothetical protein
VRRVKKSGGSCADSRSWEWRSGFEISVCKYVLNTFFRIGFFLAFFGFWKLIAWILAMFRSGGAEPDRAVWKKAYGLYLQAFQEPLTPIEKKKLKRILAKPLSEEIRLELFEYDAFLRGLGRMSLSKLLVDIIYRSSFNFSD